jgi:hypothetical protein
MTRFLACIMMLLSSMAMAQEKKQPARDSTEPKTLSGISIMGNNEAPKSLYIVPWKAADLGNDNGLTPGMLDARNAPVDKEVFMREINYYDLRSPK